MGSRAKAVGVMLALGGLFAFAALASPATAKAAPRKREDLSPDDAAPEGEEVSVTMPGPDGAAEEGPEIVIEDDVLEEEAAIPDAPLAEENQWVVPAGDLARLTVRPDEGVTAQDVAARVRSSIPDLKSVSTLRDGNVSIVATDDEEITIRAQDLRRRFEIPATIINVEALEDSQEALRPIVPASVPVTDAPAPSAVSTEPQEPPAAELVEEVLPDATSEELSEAAAKVAEEVTGGEQPTPLIEAETAPDMDDKGTNALARLLLARENLPGWKTDLQEDVKEWQQGVGLTPADGKFGPGSAARMAEEVGVLPLIRFYPKSIRTKSEGAVLVGRKVRAVMLELQKDLPMSQAHIQALEASLKREKQQSMGTEDPPPQKTREWVTGLVEEIGSRAEEQAERELS